MQSKTVTYHINLGASNLPLHLQTGSGSVQYAYNAEGLRTEKHIGNTVTHYVRGKDGEVLASYVNSAIQSQPIYAGGEMIGNYDRSQRRYYIKDHLGSIRTTVDENGAVAGYDDYYPYGLTMPGRSSNTGNPNADYKFTGYEVENDLGLNLFNAGARLYDPIIGRFMQVDPLATDYPGWSPYNYVMGNPLSLIDPTGESVICALKKDCEQAASDINELHDGAGVEVIEMQKEKKFLGFLWKTGEIESYYQLSTGNESFDWSQGGTDEFGAAIYELLSREDVSYSVIYTTENIPFTAYITNRQPIGKGGYGGGLFKDNTVYVDPRGVVGQPSSVILMHELLGHGHPVGGNYTTNASTNALRVSNHYLKVLGLSPRKGEHGGFIGNKRLIKKLN